MELRGAKVWVVGASSGIGAALARELHGRGSDVAISARDRQALEDVADGDLAVVPCDVTDQAAVAQAVWEVEVALGGIDAVVVSAGYWQQMRPGELDLESFRRHVDVNLVGLATCVSAVLPTMRARGGRIVGISSVAGYRGLPGAEAYGTTKAGQIYLLEALRAALHGTGVTVQTVCPGFVRTPMTETNTFPMPFLIDADEAARSIADGMESDRAEIVFPRRMAALMKVARLVPVSLWPRLVRPRTRPDDRAGHRADRRSPTR